MAQERPTIDVAHDSVESNKLCKRLTRSLLKFPGMRERLDNFYDGLRNGVQYLSMSILTDQGKLTTVYFYIKTDAKTVSHTIPFRGNDDSPYFDMVIRLWDHPMQEPIVRLVTVVSQCVPRLYEQLMDRSCVENLRVHIKYNTYADPHVCSVQVLI